MGKVTRNVALFFALAVAFVVIAYGAARGYASWQQGYTWTEMDWNNDGTTSVGEFFASSDIGRRVIEKGSISCVEFYRFKDGMPVKEVCPLP